MKTFKNFKEALSWQRDNGYYNVNSKLETGVVNIDRVQFALGDVFWIIIGNDYSLDDYEEWVTQYGFTASGKWAAVSGGHCSCYGWEEMEDSDITYYPSLEVLLKADNGADVIIKHKDIIRKVLPFLEI